MKDKLNKKESILYLLLFFIFSFQAFNLNAQNEKIKIGYYDNKPLLFRDENGEPKGFFVDITHHIAEKENWDTEYIYGSWEECLNMVKNSEIDLLSTIAYTDERAKYLDFNNSNILSNWGQVAIHKNSGIISIIDLENKKIALLKNDIHSVKFKKILKKFSINSTIVSVDSYHEIFEKIANGDVHAGVVNRFYGIQSADYVNVVLSDIIFNPISIKYATAKGTNADLIESIDKHITQMKESEKSIFDESLAKWFNVTMFNYPISLISTIMMILLASMMISFFIYIVILNKKISKRIKAIQQQNIEKIVLLITFSVIITLWFILAFIEFIFFNKSGNSLLSLLLPLSSPYRMILIMILNGTILYFGIYISRLLNRIASQRIKSELSAEDIRMTLLSIGDAVISTDTQSRVTRINPIAEVLTGWKFSDAKGKKLSEIFKIYNALTGEIVENPVQKVLDFGETVGLANHTKLISKDGSVYQISDSASPIKDVKGMIKGVVLVFRDVTNEYNMQKKLQNSEKKYRNLFETTSEGLWIVDKSFKTIDVNDSLCEMLGYSREEIFDKPIMEFLDLENQHILEKNSSQKNRTVHREYEIELSKKDNSLITVLIASTILHNEKNEIMGSFAFLTDITELRQTQKALNESEKRYRTIFGTTGTATCIMESDGTIVLVNKKFEKLAGYSANEIVNKINWKKFVVPEDYQRMLEQHKLRRKQPEESLKEYEFRFVDVKGKIYDIFLTIDMIPETSRSVASLSDISGLKRSEKRLRERSENLSFAQSLAHIGNYKADVNSGMLYLSDELKKIIGVDLDLQLFTIQDGFDKVFRNDLKRLKKNIGLSIKEKKQINSEYRIKKTDGTIRFVDSYNHPIFDSEGNLKYVLGTVQDITEKKIAQQRLQESQNRLLLLVENMPVMLNAFDSDGNIVLWNRECEEVTGYSKKEIIGNPNAFELIYPTFGSDEISNIDGRNVIQSEQQMQHKDGTVKTVIWTDMSEIVPISGWSKWAVGINISERKAAEQKLVMSENNLRTLFNAMTDLVFELDYDGTYINIAPTSPELLYYPSEKLIGKKVQKILPKKIGIKFYECIKDSIDENKVKSLEYFLEMKGKNIWFEARFTPKTSNSVLAIVRDISEKKEIEKALIRVEKLESIGTLAGGIAHDFNNVLTGLYGNISLALIKLQKDSKPYAYLKEAEKSMNRATLLTNQLLTFSKGGDPKVESVSLKKLVEDIVRFDLVGSNILPVFDISDDLWIAEVDKGQMQQVFSNLTINAKQAMPDGGFININLENEEISDSRLGLENGKYIKATFQDSGAGIDKSHLTKIFDPYFTTKKAGNGLGLATIFSIIEKHSGAITVTSEVGMGTIFTIYLPATDKESEPEITQDIEFTTSGKTANVLVMDDEKIVREVCSMMLETLGYTPIAVSEGKSLLDMYKRKMNTSEAFDLVILDLTIPGGMGGEETIKHLLKLDPNAKCIVSSGYYDNPVMANYKSYGFKSVVSKPYTVLKLDKTIQEVLK